MRKIPTADGVSLFVGQLSGKGHVSGGPIRAKERLPNDTAPPIFSNSGRMRCERKGAVVRTESRTIFLPIAAHLCVIALSVAEILCDPAAPSFAHVA